jgi:hypothetical protein
MIELPLLSNLPKKGLSYHRLIGVGIIDGGG